MEHQPLAGAGSDSACWHASSGYWGGAIVVWIGRSLVKLEWSQIMWRLNLLYLGDGCDKILVNWLTGLESVHLWPEQISHAGVNMG